MEFELFEKRSSTIISKVNEKKSYDFFLVIYITKYKYWAISGSEVSHAYSRHQSKRCGWFLPNPIVK